MMGTAEWEQHAVSGDRRMPIRISLRWLAMALVASMVAAAGGLATFKRLRSQAPAPLVGSALTPPVSTFGFRLRDQDGRNVSLASFR